CCRGRLLQRPARAHDFHPSFPTRRSSDLAVLWGVLRGRAGERERRCQRMAIRVVIADDHPLLRQGLVKILSMEPDMEVVAEAQDAEEVLQLVAEHRPDIVLMDINMPKGGGLGATREISRRWPEVGVIVLTIHDEDQYLYELISAGARGYLLKDSEPARVVEAIRHVYQGGSFVPPDLMNKVLCQFRRLQSAE